MNKYLIMWWEYSGKKDDYVDHDDEFEADSEQQALSKAKQQNPKGKNFKTLWEL